MISKWRWLLLQFSRKLWLRASLFAALAVVTALLSIVLAKLIPGDLPKQIGAASVDHILDILASSMLAVTTFSLGVMVSAYSAATAHVTPRATRLLMEDTSTQNMLGTFIGTFLYSLVGIIALSAGAYGERGRAVLFMVTILVIVLMVATLLRWIEHLSKLGRVSETTDRVEEATVKAVSACLSRPSLGGRPWDPQDEPAAESASPIAPIATGYVQHIDLDALSDLARPREGRPARPVYINALPGTFVHPHRPLACFDASDDDERDAIREAFSIDDERSFDQDPRFGLAVLAEIASRALSPAVNDPGTAIDVIGRAVRVLSRWARDSDKPPDDDDDGPEHPHIRVPRFDIEDLFNDVFTPIARDGAAMIEVQLRLQKALLALSQLSNGDFRKAALRHSQLALQRAAGAMALESDLAPLRDLANAICSEHAR